MEKLIDEKIPEIEKQAKWLKGLTPAEEIILEEPVRFPQDQDDQEPFSDSEEDRGPS